ncbi:hypothetical protein HCA44_03295 [Rhodococcus sp. HNM0569]|nr:hypothetical protein [Rhodococcus sp. HNM0569]
MAKKASPHSTIDYANALEVALCHGWIDGQVKSLDADFTLRRFTPRTARSPWSKRNCALVLDLDARGLLTQAGRAEMERAQADGRWDRAYEGQAKAEVPQDFLDALAQNDAAAEFFATLDRRNRYSVVHRLQQAVRPETRARRIAQFVEMFARGEAIHRAGR